MLKQPMGQHRPARSTNRRSQEMIRAHYQVEKALARRLRDALPEERRVLYSSLYDELYRRVPQHPQLTRKSSPSEVQQAVEAQLSFLSRFLDKAHTFLEIGPGDCALSFELAGRVRRVYAVDVSDAITRHATRPENFELFLSDGSSVPVPPGCVNVAYSNQLMEHLHPDDAWQQLRNIYEALAAGGHYVCITPNRLSGPHDVSKYFDDVATGLHLKEYTTIELQRLFRQVGFSRVTVYIGARGRYLRCPLSLVGACERLLEGLPHAWRKALVRGGAVGAVLGIRLVGTK
ncbi:class I SAM-dependent methyltransferase [Halomonas nitroreducens]|uniref:Class I SAM-dependent methyltransferase n=1 Tax=Halomonas nitroreducens TaxID=447425 RepID=A0A431V6B9_9GAMM|nr:class I SAM-dependent methyltransferase [Halomonas nitroreducens]RTR05338.1 class I SAM-dependent methyltransferase [Halomonas nitroreducens]